MGLRSFLRIGASREVEWREGQGNTVEELLREVMEEPRGGRGDRRDLGVIWWDRGRERWQWAGLPPLSLLFSALLHPQHLLKTQLFLLGLQAFGREGGEGCVWGGDGGSEGTSR